MLERLSRQLESLEVQTHEHPDMYLRLLSRRLLRNIPRVTEPICEYQLRVTQLEGRIKGSEERLKESRALLTELGGLTR